MDDGRVSDVSAPVEPAPVRRGRSSRSVADMIRSLLVVGGVVVVLVLIVPRPSAVTQPPIDVTGIAQGARASAGFTISVPQGLPTEWRATSARLLDGTDDVQTWHVGYQTSDGQYAAVEQAKDATAVWLRSNTQDGDPAGTQSVDGVTWNRILHENRLQRTLQLVHGDLTTLVTGTASWDELGRLAASLQPAP
jgi:hypothetical protein